MKIASNKHICIVVGWVEKVTKVKKVRKVSLKSGTGSLRLMARQNGKHIWGEGDLIQFKCEHKNNAK